MSVMTCIDQIRPVCDIADTMTAPPKPPLYDALMAVRPKALTPNAWAVRAGVNRNIFNDIRRNGNATHDTLQKLLDAIDVSFAEFDAGVAPKRASTPSERSVVSSPVQAFRGNDRPRDVPVLGTPRCGDLTLGDQHIETIDVDLDEVVDYVRRPAALDGRNDVYAIYYTGFSMVPRFEPDEVGYVDPRRPPAIGDYVVIQLRGPDPEEGERVVSALVKRLVRRTATYIELEQFNPPATFRLPTARVARIHRIMKLGELVGF